MVGRGEVSATVELESSRPTRQRPRPPDRYSQEHVPEDTFADLAMVRPRCMLQ